MDRPVGPGQELHGGGEVEGGDPEMQVDIASAERPHDRDTSDEEQFVGPEDPFEPAGFAIANLECQPPRRC